MAKMTDEQKAKIKEGKDKAKAARAAAGEQGTPPTGTSKPPVEKAEVMDPAEFQQAMLKIAQGMATKIEGVSASVKDLTVRITRVEGKPLTAPSDFEATMDENVPPAASKSVREVLGNKVLLRAREAEGQPGFFLDIIIPDTYHTKYQIGNFKQQREVITKDPNTGKVIDRRMEDWIQEDIRSRYIPQFGMIDNAKKWAMAVADNINREFAKARLPAVNFFE